ncbi:hypothetical protein JL09_g4629 [Pichia kudriavzevii]|uniref:Uncharacterized protein n=1 Tax=Pichia kudriavzevii TaxID=4909 RepID=A0A099NTN3_PICKU|nr:hypothetical protein JL09_g4629 [Pichia kudriavzevii]
MGSLENYQISDSTNLRSTTLATSDVPNSNTFQTVSTKFGELEIEDPLSSIKIIDNITNKKVGDEDEHIIVEKTKESTVREEEKTNQENTEHNFDVESVVESDVSSVSFDLYMNEFARDKIIEQIEEEKKNDTDGELNISQFLLKNYKYRDLGELSSGFGDLIKGIDTDLIELVNENYLSFINLGKSIDGSLDLIHDIRIDMLEYSKTLKLNNEKIDIDMNTIERLRKESCRLSKMENLVRKIIVLFEMVECFDKLCTKFDKYEDSTDMLKELVGLYFGINDMLTRVSMQSKRLGMDELVETGILFNINKRMHGLNLEFKSLMKIYLNHLKEINTTNEDIFEVFKLYHLLNFTKDFQRRL